MNTSCKRCQALSCTLLFRVHAEGVVGCGELFERLSLMHSRSTNSKDALAKEKLAREEAENKVATLEAEHRCSDAAWHREMEGKENLIKGYKLERTTRTASIQELHREVDMLKDDTGHLKHGITKWNDRLKSLVEDVESERCHKVKAKEGAESAYQLAGNLKLELAEERLAHEALKIQAQDLEVKLTRLDSAEYKKQVVEEYCHSPLGRAEVAPACKAGVDYLASLLPPSSQLAPDRLYPPMFSATSTC